MVKAKGKIEKKNSNGKFDKVLFQKILNIALWVILFAWMGLCIIDFIVIKTNNNPIFCLKKDVYQYDDGTVKSCFGVGYKIYQYNRTSFNGIEFGPFWAKDKSNK